MDTTTHDLPPDVLAKFEKEVKAQKNVLKRYGYHGECQRCELITFMLVRHMSEEEIDGWANMGSPWPQTADELIAKMNPADLTPELQAELRANYKPPEGV